MNAEAFTWVELRARCRRRWLPAIAAAVLGAALTLAATGITWLVAFPTVGFSLGLLLGAAAGARLQSQFGTAGGREAHLGEELEIRVTPPTVPESLLPMVVAAGVALLVAVLGHGNPHPVLYAGAVFSAFAAAIAGLDVMGAVVVSRWESSTGVRLYAQRRRRAWSSSAPPVLAAVPTGLAPRRPRWHLTWALLLAAIIVPAVWTAALATARSNDPWLRSLPAGALPATTSHVDPELGRVASALVGRPVQVRCWSPPDWASIERAQGRVISGFAEIAADRIHLSPEVCGSLIDLEHGFEPALDTQAGDRMSFAVTAIGHEAGHLRLGRNEAQAECFGMTTADRTATLLGADAAYAYSLQLYYRERILPRRAAEYRGGQC